MSRTARSLFCLLAIAGCNNAPSASTTRTITSVTWDANHQLVSHTVVVPVVPLGISGPGVPVAVQFDMEFNPVDATGCNDGIDFVISDAPLIRASNGVSTIDPASNLLCLSPPPLPSLGNESVQLQLLPYPTGGDWGAKARAFNSTLYFGKFINSSTSGSCYGDFHSNETANASACDQTATELEFNLESTAPSPCTIGSASCTGNALNTCDQYGEWQSEVCAAGLICSPQALSCCALPVCVPGTEGDACRTISNSCGNIVCDCAKSYACFHGTCRYLDLPPAPPGPIK